MEANVKPHIILTILHPVISLRYARLRVFSDLWLKSISHTRFEQLEANNKFSLSFSINLCGFDEYDQAHEYGNNEVLILGWSAEDVAPMSFKFFMKNRPIGARKLWITQYKLIVQLILKKVILTCSFMPMPLINIKIMRKHSGREKKLSPFWPLCCSYVVWALVNPHVNRVDWCTFYICAMCTAFLHRVGVNASTDYVNEASSSSWIQTHNE